MALPPKASVGDHRLRLVAEVGDVLEDEGPRRSRRNGHALRLVGAGYVDDKNPRVRPRGLIKGLVGADDDADGALRATREPAVEGRVRHLLQPRAVGAYGVDVGVV